MAKQVINIGASANDGTGDPLRDAFDKSNDNFTELYDTTENLQPRLNALQPIAGLEFNGTSDYAEIEDAADEFALNGKVLTFSFTFQTAATTGIIFAKGGLTKGYYCAMNTGGTLQFVSRQNVGTSVHYNVETTDTFSDGNPHKAIIELDYTTPSTPVVKFYVGNNTERSQTVITSATGTYADAAGELLAIGYRAQTSSAYFKGIIHSFAPFNLALTTTEIAAIAANPSLLGQKKWQAGATSLVGSDLVNLTTLNGGFENFTGTADDGTSDNFDNWSEDTIKGLVEATTTAYSGTYAAKLTRTDPTGGTIASNTCRVGLTPLVTEKGRAYELVFYCRGDDTNATQVTCYDNTNAIFFALDGEASTVANTGVIGTSYTRVRYTFIAPSNSIRIYFGPPAVLDAVVYIDNVLLTRIGILTRLGCTQGGGRFLPDLSGNSNDAIAASGITHLQPKESFYHEVTQANATGGTLPYNLYGGSFQPANTYIESIFVTRSTGTGTVAIGTTSGGGEIVTATADDGKLLTLVTSNPQTAADDIYLNLGATTTATLKFKFTRL